MEKERENLIRVENLSFGFRAKDLYKDDEKQFEKYTKVLYAQSKLIEGLPIDNPTELSNLVCDLLSK